MCLLPSLPSLAYSTQFSLQASVNSLLHSAHSREGALFMIAKFFPLFFPTTTVSKPSYTLKSSGNFKNY